MNAQVIPFQYEAKEIRVIKDKEGDPWWVAKDACDALGIKNSRDAVDRLDDDEKNTVVLNDGNRGNPNTALINEPGLYNLILRSDKAEAKKFRRWVTHEVLPAIRKTGHYGKAKSIPVIKAMNGFVSAIKAARALPLGDKQAAIKANAVIMNAMGVDCLELMGISLEEEDGSKMGRRFLSDLLALPEDTRKLCIDIRNGRMMVRINVGVDLLGKSKKRYAPSELRKSLEMHEAFIARCVKYRNGGWGQQRVWVFEAEGA